LAWQSPAPSELSEVLVERHHDTLLANGASKNDIVVATWSVLAHPGYVVTGGPKRLDG
jgi:hypothetical protein